MPAFPSVRRHRDGSLVPVQVQLLLVRDDRGQAVGLVALHDDPRRVAVSPAVATVDREELRAGFLDSPVPQSRTDADGTVLAVDRAMEQLRSAEHLIGHEYGRYASFLQSVPVAVFTYDVTGRCTSSRGQAVAHFSLAEGELDGVVLLRRYRNQPGVVAALRASLQGEFQRVLVDAHDRVWELRFGPVRDGRQQVVGGLCVASDVTELATAEREVRAHESRLRALLRESEDVVLVIDAQGRLLYVSAALTRVLGYDDREVLWRRTLDYDHPDDRASVAGDLAPDARRARGERDADLQGAARRRVLAPVRAGAHQPARRPGHPRRGREPAGRHRAAPGRAGARAARAARRPDRGGQPPAAAGPRGPGAGPRPAVGLPDRPGRARPARDAGRQRQGRAAGR